MKNSIIILFLLFAAICTSVFSQTDSNLKIALVYPSLTKNILYKNDSTFLPTDNWELFFLSHQINYVMVSDNSLDDISSDVNVIVIPSMVAVNEDMLEELESFLKNGKGVLITGDFAEFNEEGNRLDSAFQNRILDFRIKKTSGS